MMAWLLGPEWVEEQIRQSGSRAVEEDALAVVQGGMVVSMVMQRQE